MALHALDDLEDALAATRSFLTPIEPRTWLKLALIAFFVGVPGANFPGFQASGGGNGGGEFVPPGTISNVDVGPQLWLVVGAVVAAVLLLGLALLFVSSVMEFVLVDTVRSETVAIRRYWSDRWRQGARLFGFRLVLGVVVLGSFLLVIGPVVLSALDIGPASIGVSLALLVLLVPVFLVLALAAALVNAFTTAFVVPIMLLEDRGVVAGWRRLWPSVRSEWKQYLAYAVVGFLLSATGGVLVGIAVLLAALVLLIPFGILFAIGFGVFLVVPPAGIAVFAVVGLLFALAVLTAVALAQVPVVTYLRYYSLLILGDIEPDLDVIPDQRAAVRASDADDSDPDPEAGV
ncbi:DUF7544 domain-containing protein [Haloglomus salinum]|jgi:hypothetical protein|uniref:DUF7544 domain-containing protein n=1 Tax=Haloglomus salinum TaxID=2962673 RepID=UPI0020C98BF8|nr:hypothetical protein [Haloglomus salinum]